MTSHDRDLDVVDRGQRIEQAVPLLTTIPPDPQLTGRRAEGPSVPGLASTKVDRTIRGCAASLHGSVLMTMATKAKYNQVIEFIVSESTAVF